MPRQAFTCEYCEFTGSINAVRDHESKCIYNPFLRSCFTCKLFKNRTYDGWMCYKTLRLIINQNTIVSNCPHWENPDT